MLGRTRSWLHLGLELIAPEHIVSVGGDERLKDISRTRRTKESHAAVGIASIHGL